MIERFFSFISELFGLIINLKLASFSKLYMYISTQNFTLFRFESIFGCQGKTLPLTQEVEPDDVTSGQGWVRRAARVTLHWPIRYWLLGRTRPCLTPYFLQTIFDTHFFSDHILHFFQTIFDNFFRWLLQIFTSDNLYLPLEIIYNLWSRHAQGRCSPWLCRLYTAHCSVLNHNAF